ncbi:YppG family protein [Natribacillus halophilus]|uniref:YppG-like protein n=1 Tax=Natribacillus halophilus TaxID=549003 RepID=A0A1G8SIP5_9BACI|nr:YppG family protein [Natribacillus halophilus]SDJ29071.1 YppG-like protein [Natribacillus halophilus]
MINHRPPYYEEPYMYPPRPYPPSLPPISSQPYGAPPPPFPPGAKRPSTRGMSGFMSGFTNEDGQIDVQKTMATIDTAVKTYQQVSPMIKQITSVLQERT